MSLRLCTDLSPAGWLVGSELSWDRLVTMGPGGFPAYARLRFIPDPQYPGQRENDLDVDPEPSPHDQLALLLHILDRRTATPDDCYFCLWDGWGVFDPAADRTAPETEAVADPDPSAVPGLAPAPVRADPRPKVSLPNRSYYLFRGPLEDFGDWGVGARGFPEPAFVWPDDHGWCVTKDVDPHWAGIGADRATIDTIIADQSLDIVPADPTRPQPAYR